MSQVEDLDKHDVCIRVIAVAVAGLWPKFGPEGIPPECIFEGAIRGAAVVLFSIGAKPNEVAELLSDMADGFRNLAPPKLRLVHGRVPGA